MRKYAPTERLKWNPQPKGKRWGTSWRGYMIEKEKKMIAKKIQEIIANSLGVEVEKVTLETSLMKDLKADSLSAVEAIMAIEEEFEIEIDDEDAEEFDTIQDIVEYVKGKI